MPLVLRDYLIFYTILLNLDSSLHTSCWCDSRSEWKQTKTICIVIIYSLELPPMMTVLFPYVGILPSRIRENLVQHNITLLPIQAVYTDIYAYNEKYLYQGGH